MTASTQLVDATVEFSANNEREAPTRVLHSISLDVPEGELLVLVGKSGCGKTTMLNLFAGLLEPTEGSVRVLGVTPAVARERVGYMFARDALLPWRSARRNVEYGLELRGVARDKRTETARRYLDMVGLTHAGDRWPWQLSQGMRQRVALARTWALDPALLLMDEPFAALDAQTRESVQREFLRIWETDRKTVVFVTHDLSEAIALGDRVVLVGDGRILANLAIEFERPRDLAELSTTSEFQTLRRQLRELLA